MKKNICIETTSWPKVKPKLTEFLSPDEVFLPIDPSAKILTKKKYIWKSDPLYEWNQKIYYSPISGHIKKIIPVKIKDKTKYYLQIENDFQEKDHYTGVEHTTMMITNDVKKRIKTYQNHFFDELKSCDTIVLLGISKDPFLANQTFLHRLYMNEILLMLDVLASTYHIKNVYIYLKENDLESIEALEEVQNRYPIVKQILIKDYYPYGNPFYFKKEFHYDEKTKIYQTEEIFDAFYEIIKLRKKDFLLLTVTGDAIENPQVLKVKIGTSLKTILKECITLKKGAITILKNSLISGEIVDENLILTEDIKGIFLMKTKEKREEKCIHCGKCNLYCPMNCNPYKMVQTSGIWQDKKCIQCGLCSYLCPSHIDILKKEGEK